MKNILLLIRPKQWLKNVFVLVPLSYRFQLRPFFFTDLHAFFTTVAERAAGRHI